MLSELGLESSVADTFFSLKAEDIHYHYNKPTLIHLNKELGRPLFISCLIHGNENAGLYAVQKVLKKYAGLHSFIIFIGNPLAASKKQRHLDSQPDFNRIWSPENFDKYPMTKKVYDYVKECQPIAVIDIHNTTGKNPHFSCINYKNTKTYKFASLFGGPILFFKKPSTVLANILGEFCPSITVECGLPDTEAGVARAFKFIDTILKNKKSFLDINQQPNSIYKTIAKIKPTALFDIGLNEQPLSLDFDLEDFNFKEVPIGTIWAEQKSENQMLKVTNNSSEDLYSEYFEIRGSQLVVKKAFIPAMVSLKKTIIQQDCLCYIIKKMSSEELIST